MVIRYAHPEDHDAAVQLWAAVGFPTMSDDEWEVIVRSQSSKSRGRRVAKPHAAHQYS